MLRTLLDFSEELVVLCFPKTTKNSQEIPAIFQSQIPRQMRRINLPNFPLRAEGLRSRPPSNYRNAQGSGPKSTPKRAAGLLCVVVELGEPQNCQKALLGARRPKAVREHSSGRFSARTPGHSCILRALDGRNHMIVIGESLARVIAAIRITSVRWWSYLPHQIQTLIHSLCCDSNRAIGLTRAIVIPRGSAE